MGRWSIVKWISQVPNQADRLKFLALASVGWMPGPTPQTSKGTHILVPMGTRLSDKSWGAELVETDGNSMTLKVTTSPTAVIGKYQFSVKTRSKAGEYPAPFDPRYEIYVLFNPWCSELQLIYRNQFL
uniref:Uncharacterized protein n=1 Tax=Sphaerodactylus townsendi TaxID=933632 RepID=A0ACB8EX63_9SAUR